MFVVQVFVVQVFVVQVFALTFVHRVWITTEGSVHRVWITTRRGRIVKP